METKNLLNKKITQWLLLVAMLFGCSASAWAWFSPTYRFYFDASVVASTWDLDDSGYYLYAKVFYGDNQSSWNIYQMTKVSDSNYLYYTDSFKNQGNVSGLQVFAGKNNGDYHNGMEQTNLNGWGSFLSSLGISCWDCSSTSNWAKLNATKTPPLTSVSIAAYSTTTISGTGTSSDPYIVAPGTKIQVKATPTVHDTNIKAWYKFTVGSSEDSNYSTTTTKTVVDSAVDGTTYSVSVKGKGCDSSSSSSNISVNSRSSSTLYFKAETQCTTPTATQYPMTNATVTYDGNSHAPTITPTPASGAGTVAKVYYNGSKASGKTNVGTYAITVDVNAGTTYCAATGISLGNFVINRASRTISITNSATTFCQSETPTVTSSVSAGGTDGTISYSIESGGTGTATINSSTGVITCTAPGTVIVKASISEGTNYVAAKSETKTFTFTAKPTAYNVSGTASICTGNSTNITLAGSQTGYTYKLYKDGSATSTTQEGTGTALNFSVSEAGTYTVKGYVTDNESCIADMNEEATITIKNAVVNPQPELSNIHPYEVVTLTATNKDNVTWTITKTPDNVIIDKNAYFTEGNTGKTVKFKGALGDGYQITATANGCDTEINFNIISDSEVCN